MKPDRTLLKETARMAVGVLILTLIMFGVYAVLGRLNASVALGGLYAAALTLVNFFVMGLTVQRITDTVGERQRSEEEIETLTKQMKARMQASYSLRMVALFGLIALGIAAFGFDPLATLIPVVFPRVVIAVMQLMGKVS